MNPDDWRDTPLWCCLLFVPLALFLLAVALVMGEKIEVEWRRPK